ncbi:adenylate/guanylate cyclase domain-containing protein [Salinispira pacifica]|uniref:Adenylate cyclase n=1 Tax=Salinispira pacifica TaxID=1307761 RepID=V5WDK6_9SPIO|nr:adenylate/guanylate cyclase domain-containing protein [Salinispira pacifica]AHC13867.1 Adenylate cyclase [Salinispira pacifica]
MKIRTKFVLVVLPVMIVSIVLVGASSFFLATSGINRIAREFLGFKINQLETYAVNQYRLLVDNGLQNSEEFIQATKGSVQDYASSLTRSGSERIFAVDADGNLEMNSGDLEILEEERAVLADLYARDPDSLQEISIGGEIRVGRGFRFEPFQWYVLVTELRSAYFQDINRITTRTLYLLAGAILVATLVLFYFTGRLTRPLNTIVQTMREIISTSDLSQTVPVEYNDETGTLAHTFNIMTGELDKAYQEIKRFARDAAIAEHKEKKVRQIFQKYVPQELIDRFFQSPESMLVGEDRVLAILFSDIRSFTTISEAMHPSDLVNQLNVYFDIMVEIIMKHGGIVDKYIGDAIMAIFGAPVKHDDDALRAVNAGLDMVEALVEFNKAQRAKGFPEFLTGIGINYGIVTVGNIGAEKKMDYTVIGDMVNLASRLEGLTKEYRQELIISESLQRKVAEYYPTRHIDTVTVKGKTRGIKIYAVRRDLDARTAEAWEIHQGAMDAYFPGRDFQTAARRFRQVLEIFPEDYIAAAMIAQCEEFIQNPPPDDWNGVKKMKTK